MLFWDCHYAFPGNIHTPPAEVIGISWGRWEGGGGVCKTDTFKETYEAALEFPVGWGVEGSICIRAKWLIKPELILFSVA